MTFRFKCPKCGEVFDANGDTVCKCGTPLSIQGGGMLKLYRKGSPLGIANGFGIYLNGEAAGYIGNKQTVCIPVAFGSYNMHIACGMNRRCEDLVHTVTPEAPLACAKVYMKPGFWTNSFVVEPATPADMPE